MSLAGKTVLITGATRGIGLAIASRAARDGANVVVTGKTTSPHVRLPGTIYSAAQEIEALGGKALPIAMDLRSEDDIEAAVAATVQAFGGIDILVNNASALFRAPTERTSVKRFDLMSDVNLRGTWMIVRACIPHLRRAPNPHVLSIAPLLRIESPERYGAAPAFMISKFSISLMTMAFATEFAADGIAFNALWPRLAIWTPANQAQHGDINMLRSRRPEIMADAAWQILTQDARRHSGRFMLDDDVLRDAGVTDFSGYYYPGADPATMFVASSTGYGLDNNS